MKVSPEFNNKMKRELLRHNQFFKAGQLMAILMITIPLGLSAQQEVPEDSNSATVRYGDKGFEFQTKDDAFLLQIQSRLQFRFATPDDQDPVTFDDFSDEKTNLFKINRARLKVGGHAFKPWLKYYWEYELGQSNLLDFRIMIEKWDWLSFKAGQWKVEYSRERRISSGEQQMVDRSIINRPFTVDRQQGIEIYGHIKGKGLLDFNYWTAILTGTGRGSPQNDDDHLMYFARGQWNVLGGGVDFEGCDLERSSAPAATIAVSWVTNQSPYTRFSQSGGGSLQGFEDGEIGQYRVSQYNFETAFKYQGFSWQSEFHRKEIKDTQNNNETTHLQGYYLQAGYFLNEQVSWWPEPLELAFRYGNYHPDTTASQPVEEEKTMAVNWFFKGHKNKLTMEVSHFDVEEPMQLVSDTWRFRLQWDISL